ncbi:MAG: AEC family transporter [Chloroflexi bacterium]|nr:AEC family transporter [Chloroflexota bacterium]
MNNLFPLFSNNILPIFLTAGTGWLIGRFTNIDIRTIARIAFYIFSPALIFQLITNNYVPGNEFARMAGLAIAVTAVLSTLAWTIGKLVGLHRRMLAAVLLVSIFPNAGNYGLSAVLLARGETGLALASIYFVTMATITYTVGVVIASMGKKSFVDSAKGLLKIPVLYALAGAYMFNLFHWALPVPLKSSIELLSQAAIPTMLLLLGLQLQRAVWKQDLLALGIANGLRLVVSPIVAIGLGLAIGISGLSLQVGVLQAAMPSAVMTIILATEFQVEPEFVTTAVATSTLLSPLTLTPLMAFLG